MPLIYLYQDEGTSKDSFDQFSSALKLFSTSIALKGIEAKEIVNQDQWMQADLLIVPGGRDLPYHAKLKGKGNEKVRRYVNEGGRYLGVCAGAYYACREILFEKGTEHEVHQMRELSFFSGQAIGALYKDPPFSYENNLSAVAATIEGPNEKLKVYYHGGCHFAHADCDRSVIILSHYLDFIDRYAAIIECSFGQGKAILSGVHFEVIPECIRENKTLAEQLHAYETERRELFSSVMKRLLS